MATLAGLGTVMRVVEPAGRDEVPVVQVDAVSKVFGHVMAVDNVSLSIEQGEFFSLLGPSGCGKTTTLRMIAGFETPTSGRILLEGKDVSYVPPYRRNVNMVFQQYALFPHMNVFENVAFGPKTKGVPRKDVPQRVMDALRIVRLEEFAKRKPSQLSGGEQQRVALARALVNYPSALLLDEPLGALDLKLRQAMQLELKRIQREVGITFVYVTHDQEEALTMSDRIAVINEGKVEQMGTPEEIYDRPASAFVAGFIGLASLLPATVENVGDGAVGLSLSSGDSTKVMAGTQTFRVGDAALLVLRPERLSISAEEPDSEATGRVRARIKDLVFQGPVLRLALECNDGCELVIVTSPQNRPSRVGSGDDVWVTWAVEDGYVLPTEETR